MSFWRAYIGTRILETSQNDASADAPPIGPPEERSGERTYWIHADEEFWHAVLGNPDCWWGARFHTNMPLAVAEWVARVPGLFWKPDVQKFREFNNAAVEVIGRWTAYPPPGKSMKVASGVGTLRLPPADDGTRLVSLSGSLNASAGIPILVLLKCGIRS